MIRQGKIPDKIKEVIAPPVKKYTSNAHRIALDPKNSNNRPSSARPRPSKHDEKESFSVNNRCAVIRMTKPIEDQFKSLNNIEKAMNDLESAMQNEEIYISPKRNYTEEELSDASIFCYTPDETQSYAGRSILEDPYQPITTNYEDKIEYEFDALSQYSDKNSYQINPERKYETSCEF